MRKLLLWFTLLFAAPAHAEWWEARTDHFIVYSQSSKKSAREFAEKLERFDGALRSLQRIEPDDELSDSRRLTMFRFGDIDHIAAFRGSGGVAGFYQPRASGPVAFVPAKDPIGKKSLIDDQVVLFHEYTHHFMFRYFAAAYPSWYVEGFAEVNATIDLKEDGSFMLGAPPQHRADDFNNLNYSIEKMLLSSNRPDWTAAYGRYSYGWLLIHYLTFEPTRKGQLQKFLKLINNGTDPREAAKQAFGEIEQLDSGVRRYKARNRFPGALVQPGNRKVPTVEIRKLGPDEEAIMWVRMRSTRGVTRKQAGDVASDARSIAKGYPNSLPVVLGLVEAEFDARNWDAAERAADAALALDPKSVKAMLYKGYVYLEHAKKDAKHFATARSWFAKANRADPGHPSPLYNFYLTYKRAGTAPPPMAVAGLERAFELAPYDDDVRLSLARQLLVEKKGPLARRVLMPLALSPHESKSARKLHEVAELIETGKPGEALTKLDTLMREAEKKSEKEDRPAGLID